MTQRHLATILIACALALGACAKKGVSPPAEDADHAAHHAEALPEPTDNSALDESDETPEQPDGTAPP